MANTKRLAKIMKALANENRLALFLEIAQQQEVELDAPGCRISDIVGVFRLSAPTISHHLKEMVNADLIETERRGRFLVARIKRETIAEVEDFLKEAKG